MPIVVDNKRGITYLKFGEQDILVGTSNVEGSGYELLFTTTGMAHPDGIITFPVPDFKIRVMMKFGTLQSIDTVIHQLNEHRQFMIDDPK